VAGWGGLRSWALAGAGVGGAAEPQPPAALPRRRIPVAVAGHEEAGGVTGHEEAGATARSPVHLVVGVRGGGACGEMAAVDGPIHGRWGVT
jgi:hypothetical protein